MKTKAACIVVSLALLAGCMGGLPRALRRDIAWEHDKLQSAEPQIERSGQTVQSDLAQNADLFVNTPVAAQWTAQLEAAREKLKEAQAADAQLAELVRRNRADLRDTAERLLNKERTLREAAIDDSQAVETAAAKWIGFRHDLASNLDKMKREYDDSHAVDLAPVEATVQKAEHDWPLKKDALDTRLSALRAIPQDSQQQWDATAAPRQDASAGKVSGPEVATLIHADAELAHDAESIRVQANELRNLCGQLYDSWDKVLTDLDATRDGRETVYREQIKTVRTHISDVASHTTETSSAEAWVTVPEPSYRAVEDDLGMAIAHKNAGLFDFEAQTTPEPAGFAYIAPESQGSNQYGYWNHSGGETFWTFLPQYLILRELLWNHAYRPVVLDDYRGYQMAQRTGHTYYGRTSPASPPKYGSHGTFTQTRYASSRYVQSGGFRGSAYASRGTPGASGFSGSHGPDRGAAPGENSAGKRFGSAAHPPSGRHFGMGARPGRAFGRRR